MTIFERMGELETAGAVYRDPVPGGDCTGDPSPEMYVVALGRSVGLSPEESLDLGPGRPYLRKRQGG